jgi:hypothetical protein
MGIRPYRMLLAEHHRTWDLYPDLKYKRKEYGTGL